jgi:Putative zinc-finger
MTIPTMTCEQFVDRLADYLESDVNEPARIAMEAHAARCGDCGALLADLRELRVDAAALPPRVPERDLWAGIAARIETPVVEISPAGPVDAWTRRNHRMRGVWTGLAAAGLVAVTATVTYQVTRRTTAVTPPTVAVVAKSPSTDTQAAPAPKAIDTTPSATAPSPLGVLANNPGEQKYDVEISRLRAIVSQRRSMLDTATVSIFDRNLKIIDDAIAQCRMALRKDPASRFLMQSLNDALDSKIQLLRSAAALPSRA